MPFAAAVGKELVADRVTDRARSRVRPKAKDSGKTPRKRAGATHRASGVTGALTRKFGGVPAWAILGGLGVVIYLWRKRTQSAATPGTTVTGPSAQPFGGFGGFGGGAGSSGDSSGGGGTNPAPTPDTTTPTPIIVPTVAPSLSGVTTPTVGASKTAPSSNVPAIPRAALAKVSNAQIVAGQAAVNQKTVVQKPVVVGKGSFTPAVGPGSVVKPGPVVGGVAKPATVVAKPAPKPARTTAVKRTAPAKRRR